jgi:hypothetical protein
MCSKTTTENAPANKPQESPKVYPEQSEAQSGQVISDEQMGIIIAKYICGDISGDDAIEYFTDMKVSLAKFRAVMSKPSEFPEIAKGFSLGLDGRNCAAER